VVLSSGYMASDAPSQVPANGSPNGVVSSLDSLMSYAQANSHVQRSINIIKECLSRCSNESKFCVSFNGGKDCTVLLHLLSSVLQSKTFPSFQHDDKIPALYIKITDMFSELQEFVDLSVERYKLKLLVFDGPDFKKALRELKEQESHLEYIFMGTRATDSSRPLATLQKTDEGWPSFTRVNPLLDWTYSQIWSFLRDLKVPYCCLYDKGYTSLGSRSNTQVNPKLKRVAPDATLYYLPAYMLSDPDQERSGRNKC